MKKFTPYAFLIAFAIVLIIFVPFLDRDVDFKVSKITDMGEINYAEENYLKLNDDLYIDYNKGIIKEIIARNIAKPGDSFGVSVSHVNKKYNMNVELTQPVDEDYSWFKVEIVKGKVNLLTINNKEVKIP